MIRFSKLAAAMAVVPVLAVSGSALAGSPGQLAGGPGNTLYQVKNLTQKGAYASSISGTACNDEIQYSMELSNTEFGALTNVVLKATLPSNGGTSTATATTDLGGTSGTTSSVNVTLGSNQTQSYENGSTVLYAGNGSVIKTLSDGVTTSGVNVGTINGSTTEFVNFKAKVSCPTPTPPQVSLACVELDVKNIDRTHYDFTAKGTVENANITGYSFTSKDSNGKVVDTFNDSTNSKTSDVYHFNQEAGTYTVSAQLNTDHGSNSNSNCVKTITVATPPTTPPTTPPAKTLPNTGAGDVLGIFTGASAAGGVGHYFIARRKRGL